MNVSSIIVVSDAHIGCQLGLCPPRGNMDSGGTYTPSAFQQKLADWWGEFWTWVDEATEGDRYAVVFNGDAMDGRHHGATTQWTQSLSDQQEAAVTVLQPVVKRCGGRYYHIRGTEAHVGPAGENEESLATRLGAVPCPETGNRARWELWKWVKRGKRQVLVHIMHHIGTTGSQHYESTAVHKELIEAYSEAGRWGGRPPDVIVRSHRHRLIRTEVPTANERGVAIVTPGWQGKTPLVFRIAGGRQSQPMFGGILVRIHPSGEPYVRHWVRSLTRPEPE